MAVLTNFFKRYFTYDNEYISGTTYFLRMFLWQLFLVLFIIPGLYWIGIVVYKRAMSLGLNHEKSLTFAILLALFLPLSMIILPCVVIVIPLHLYLWFSNGTPSINADDILED